MTKIYSEKGTDKIVNHSYLIGETYDNVSNKHLYSLLYNKVVYVNRWTVCPMRTNPYFRQHYFN